MAIKLIYRPIRFENKDDVVSYYEAGRPLEEYTKNYRDSFDGVDEKNFDIIIDGAVIKDLSFVPKDNSEIIITPKIEHPIAVAFSAFLAWASTHVFEAILYSVLIGYSIYQAITSQKRLAAFGTANSDGLDKSSPTYGWDGIQTISEVNVPVKIICGEHRTGGNIINQFISYKTTEEYAWWSDGSYLTNLVPFQAGYSGFTVNEKCVGVCFVIRWWNKCRIYVQYKKSVDSVWIEYQNFRASHEGSSPHNSTINITELPAELYDFRIVNYNTSAIVGKIPEITAGTISAKINRPNPTDINKQYLNVLIAVGEGEIESISDILINDNPISNYKDIDVFCRYGTNDQEPIQGFEDVHNVYPVGQPLLYNSAYSYTTIDSDVEAFQINLLCPNGIFYINDEGNVKSLYISYKVEYKSNSSPTWIDLGNFIISGKTQSAIRRIFRKDGLTPDKYDIRVTKTQIDSTIDPQQMLDLTLSSIDEIKTDNLSYPNTALIGIKALATEQLSGSTPNFTFIIKGIKHSIPLVLTAPTTGEEVSWEEYYYDPDDEVFRLFADDSELYWDGTTYVTRWSANPIWNIRNFLLNTRYGAGNSIVAASLNTDKLLESALYCEEKLPDGEGGYEKRFRLDVVLDSPCRVPDILSQLCATFRAFAFNSEGGYAFAIDKPEEVVQIFGMGNILKDSFTQSWKSKKEMYNQIEVNFLDEALDYKEDTILIQDEELITSGVAPLVKSIKLFAKKKSYVIREGRYAKNLAKYINRSVQWGAGIDAIACKCGDVIGISHDVPQWGFSGRVQADSTTTLIKLDRAVELVTGKTYKIVVRFADDTVEETYVDEIPGSYTELHVDPAFTQAPATFDVYSFGEENIMVKPFRILSMARKNNGEVGLSGIEYNANVYDDSAVDLPENDYSALEMNLPDITDLVLSERIVKLKDSTIENVIDVWFNKPDTTEYQVKKYWKAKVYISDNDGESWIYRGETIEDNFQIQGDIADLTTYLVAVVSVSVDGKENSIEASPQEEISVVGKSAPPENISGFDVYQQGSFLKFTWDAVLDIDLARYQIRKGKNWNTADVIIEKIDTTDAIYPVGEVGEITFMIKAIDTSGNESLIPSSDTLTVVPPPDTGFMQIFDLWSIPLDWKLTNINLEMRNLHNIAFNRACLALSTADKWEDKEGTSTDSIILDEVFESAGEFEMMKSYDIGFKISFNVIVDADYVATDNCTLTIQISTSDDDITYSAFADIDADTLYAGRYIKFKVKIDTIDTEYNLILYDLLLYISSTDLKIDKGNDIAIPVEGKTITFGIEFSAPPTKIYAYISNGVEGKVELSNITETEMDILVVDGLGAPIATAEINYEAAGY